MTVSKSIGNPLLMAADSECAAAGGEVKISSGTKRPVSECPPRSNAGSAHIVYVRRKTEATDSAKTNVCGTRIDSTKKSTSDQGETTAQRLTPDVAPSSPSLSSTRRSVSPSLGHISSPEENIHANCSNPPLSEEDPITLWEDRYCRLQSLLKMLDQSDQHDYVQMLRSMSSVELSGHAVELEKRSIKLSTEEAAPAFYPPGALLAGPFS
ncbi:hypothetical protein PHJA_002329300 [Phtheirospermum japonicum]|uniref:Uncharacterized protein n=1 Tax=Phtheirospermum japonicum TaxID=374723 RepID=A0A830CUG8_9LAMI|nr:hypothetical protein PHJA_002329300 [Phtheirospermum japonicum]